MRLQLDKEVIFLIYPNLLKYGDVIGVCAPSSGVPESLFPRLDKAKLNVGKLGYSVLESASVRKNQKCVSADAKTRAAEFMRLYEDPSVAAIIPPWGGEFLMDMLEHIDFERLSALQPKWVCGYSDISTLTFVLTVNGNMGTVHGSNFMNLGYAKIHESDGRLFDVLSSTETTQRSAPFWGVYEGPDIEGAIYNLDKPSRWKALNGNAKFDFSGRMIGGCMDTLGKILGTRFASVEHFIERYKSDGFVWTLESCEMQASDIYRTLWQMRECGWFQHCNGVIYGRADGYSDSQDFTLVDALTQGLGGLNIPVIFDADIGHIPPQMQIVNGAYGHILFEDGAASVTQRLI